MRSVKFTRSARRHRIGKADALAAMEAAGEPERVAADSDLDDRLVWVGPDDRGLMLEVIGIDLPEYVLIIHVMPCEFRRTR